MAGWLTRATAAFRGRRDAAPEPFHIACECGGEVTGFRTSVHQKVNCLGCQRPVLVLPTNPYPPVKRAVAEPPKKKVKSVVQPAERTAPTKSSSTLRGHSGNGPTTPKTRHAESTGKTADGSPTNTAAEVVDRIDLSPMLQREKARRRTVRLVVASIVALVGVTGWSLWNRSQREQARVQIPVATDAGLAALRAGDFSTAARELTAAVKGLDTLHRTDAASQTIRQAHREAVAAYGLATVGPADLAAEFLSNAAADRQRRFQSQFGAKWLIFDAGVIQKSTASATLFELDVSLAVGDRPLQVQCDFPDLRRFAAEASPHAPMRVLFAGQIEEWIVPDASTQPVIARLRSTTAFLWCDYDALLAVGFRPDSDESERETRDLLNRQRQESAPSN